MSREEVPLRGGGGQASDVSPKVFKELGPVRDIPKPTGGVHIYMPCTLLVGLALQSQGQVKSARVVLHPSRVRTRSGGDLRLARGNSWALSKGKNQRRTKMDLSTA